MVLIGVLVAVVVGVCPFIPILVGVPVGIQVCVRALFGGLVLVLSWVPVSPLQVIEPAILPCASLVSEGAFACIGMKSIASAVAPLGVRGEASEFMELLADVWLVESALFFPGAVTSGIESA